MDRNTHQPDDLKFCRGKISQGGMSAAAIVKDLDRPKDITPRLLPGTIESVVDQLSLESAEAVPDIQR